MRRTLRKSRAAALALLAALTLVVSGCGAGPAGASPEEAGSAENASPGKTTASAEAEKQEQAKFEEFRADKTFASDLSDEDLAKPDDTIASLEDMIYALDYMAFYRIGDKVYFQIAPEYAEEIYNPYTVYQEAYRKADLADVYACQLDDSYYSEYGVIGLKYSMSKDIASEPPASVPEAPVLTSFDYEYPKAAAELIFHTDEESRQPVQCENSEQLYYLAMNGYRPEPAADSTAEELYKMAKEILSGLVTEEMTDFQKIKAVYDWLTSEVKYDAATAYTTETYLVKEQAYYLEGVFLNHCAVCDGKSKACALMLNMLGIPCYRTTGVNEGGDHAWNMVQLEDKWYILCTTYGQSDMSDSLGRLVPNYSMLLAGAETPYEWYPADKHTDVEAQLETAAFDTFAQMGEDDGMSLQADGLDGLKELLEKAADQAAANGKTEYKIEFEYTGSDKETFITEMTDYLDSLGNANAAESRSEGKERFLVFIM